VKAEIEARLAQVREAVQHARSMPMSTSAVVNRGDLLDLIGGLEAAIKEGFSEASEVVGDRDALVAAGETEAQEILRRATTERDKLVSDTDVYRLAVERGEEITAHARREADELRADADEYVEAKLANFELTLERTLEAVKRGRARLSGGHVPGLADDSDVAGMALPDHLQRGRDRNQPVD
jgi:cell division septum initiation protein DivIVA